MPRRMLVLSLSAVRKINGVSAKRGSARSASSMLNPSSSGIITSLTIRSGPKRLACSMPARPFSAESTA